jgi:CheY-like chemotaxis protein
MALEKILIVEDNPVNMELATDLLEVAGYVVCQATDAETGIEMARGESPDLILMDVSLPGMDGLTAIGVLHEDAATRDIPVMVLTAHAMKVDKERALAAGCIGFVTKPIDTRTFAKTVAGFIQASCDCESGEQAD